MNGYYYGSLTYKVQHIALLTELLRQMMNYSSVGSAVAFIGQSTLFEGRRPSEKCANFCMERYCAVILRILMYGEVDKLGKTLFQVGVIFCSETNNNKHI